MLTRMNVLLIRIVVSSCLTLTAIKAPAEEWNADFAPPDLDEKMAALSMKFGLPARNGIPVVEFHRLSNLVGGAEFSTFSRFMDAVALGLFPRFIEIHGPDFLNAHASLSETLEFAVPIHPTKSLKRNLARVRRKIPVGFRWNSRNEFETRDLQNAFRAKYGASLNEMQVDLPIRLIFTQPIELDSCDFDRQEFRISGSDKNGFVKTLLGFRERDCEFQIRPASFFSVHHSDMLVVHTPPTLIPGFVKVSPKVAQTISSARRSQNQTLYAAGVVTLHEAPLACSEAARHSHVVARMDSLTVYADQALAKKVADLDFVQYSPSVLETGVEDAVILQRESLPADHLAVVSLIAKYLPETLGAEQWERIWYYMVDLDRHRYGSASKVIEDLKKDREQYPVPTVEGDNWMAGLRSRLHVAEPPFFPYGYRATAAGKEFQFRPGQIEMLRKWLIRRAREVNGRFWIRGEIRQGEPPELSMPNDVYSTNGSSDRTMKHVIREYGPKTRFAFLPGKSDSTMYTTDDSRSTTPVVRFPQELQTLVKTIPPEILEATLSRRPYRGSFELEFTVPRVDRIDVLDAPDAVILHAEPSRLRLFDQSGMVAYEGPATIEE